MFGGCWIAFLADPVSTAFDLHQDQAWRAAAVALAVTFSANYLGIFACAFAPARARLARLLLASVGVQAVLFCLVAGEEGLLALVYVGAAGVVVLGVRGLILGAGLIAGALVASALVPGWSLGAVGPFAIGMGTLASYGFVQLLQRNFQLQRAQQEIARLAVAEERSRFSRDLHDILGHSLTVITVKSELAGRLVETAPRRAAGEIADVERLAREALADVRTTVAGYRGLTVAGELSRARQALEAAGIEADLPNAVDDVEPDRRELFGWVIREGVTNVVRHSAARTCWVRVTSGSVQLDDDGKGPGPTRTEAAGHGLAGLRERVEAAGGELSSDSSAAGGFRLRVQMGQRP